MLGVDLSFVARFELLNLRLVYARQGREHEWISNCDIFGFSLRDVARGEPKHVPVPIVLQTA